jgi:hypothetical protein
MCTLFVVDSCGIGWVDESGWGRGRGVPPHGLRDYISEIRTGPHHETGFSDIYIWKAISRLSKIERIREWMLWKRRN